MHTTPHHAGLMLAGEAGTRQTLAGAAGTGRH
jgi:hypothetical protein